MMSRDRLLSSHLKISDLEAFCAICERLSFVAAARATSMSTSAITRAVQAIELALGRDLVNRNSRSVSLTAAGEAYYEVAKSALRQLAAGTEIVAGDPAALHGWVRFSAPAVLESRILPEAIAVLADSHPGLHLDVTYTDAFVDPAASGLDFAIRGAYPLSSGLIGQSLWRYRRFLCASPGYVRQHGMPHEPVDLPDHRFVIHTGPRLLRDWHLSDGESTTRAHVRPTHRVSSGAGLLAFLEAGSGIGRVASWIAEPLMAEGRLVRVMPKYTVVSRTGQQAEMHVVHQSHALSNSSRAVIAALRESYHRFERSHRIPRHDP
jgi:DNA-binding transcriptional LysR family regulator